MIKTKLYYYKPNRIFLIKLTKAYLRKVLTYLMIFMSINGQTQAETEDNQHVLYSIIKLKSNQTSMPVISSEKASILINNNHKHDKTATTWSNVDNIYILHLVEEDLNAIKILARNNINVLRSLKPSQKSIKGKSILEHRGTRGTVVAYLLKKICLVNYLWKVKDNIKIYFYTGIKPINNKFSCNIVAWVFALNNIKFRKLNDERSLLISD